MILTKEEALTKWCPFSSEQRLLEAAIKELEATPGASVADIVLTLRERLPEVKQNEECRGDACMEWRWSAKEIHKGFCGLGKRPAGEMEK